MNRQEKEKRFGGILDVLQEIKNGIVSDCTSELMYTGVMPAEAQKELKVLAGITGAVFGGLQTLGTEITQDPEHEGLVLAKIDGKIFSCAKVNLELEKLAAPLTASEAYSMTNETKEEAKAPSAPILEAPAKPPVNLDAPPLEDEDDFDEIEELEETKEGPSLKEENEGPLPDLSAPPSYESGDDDLDDDFDEAPDKTPALESPKVDLSAPPAEEDELDDDFDDDFEDGEANESAPSVPVSAPSFGSEELDDDFDDEEEEESAPFVPAPAPIKANVIGGTPNLTTGFSKNDVFMEENTKLASEFVYSVSKISVLHPDVGCKPEEMLVMIAPLKIMKYSSPSVPIVVTIYNRGKSVTMSSYDSLESGKNIVLIDINEYYFLVRGSFDDNGKFKASIVTTGISSNQGDKINILSHKTYGNGVDRNTRNGHIKFRYEAESGPGTIEVFPFGQPGEEDFVAIVKNDEFVDYYFISKNLRMNTRPIVYTGSGNKQELICQWDGDQMVAELVER